MKKVFYIIVPLVLLVVGFNFFKSEKSGTSSSSSSSASCVINAADYAAANKTDVTLIDVRTQREYDSGHLEGAAIIDVSQNSFKSEIEKLDKNKTYYVYCKTGIRSRNAANYMRQVGFKNVCELAGGTNSLSRAGVKLVQ